MKPRPPLMSDPRRIALFGGTFDPMHRGHVEPLLEIFEQMGWDRIVYVLAATQPFKMEAATSSALHRWAMAALATAGDDRLHLSPVELERGEISYTVDTLEQLGRVENAASFDWIIGDDNLDLLPSWRSFERILELANFIVLRRGDSPIPESLRTRVSMPEGRPRAGAVVPVQNARVNISATEIRRCVREGEPIDHLVTPGVREYIAKYGLYGAGERT